MRPNIPFSLKTIRTCRAALLVATLLAAAPASAGHYFEQTITSDGDSPGMVMAVRGWAEGEQAKIEFTKSSIDFMPPGSYLLTRDGGATVHLVNPETETYSVWDMAQAFAMIGNLSEVTGGMVNLDFKDPVSETLSSVPGGSLLGYPTTHHTWRSGFSVDMKVAFMNQSTRSITTSQAWVTEAVSIPGFFVWLRASSPTTGDPDLDQYLLAETDRMGRGLALKMEAETVSTDKRGRQSTSRSHYEVTSLREQAVDGSLFEMPATYKETPLIPGLDAALGEAQEGEEPDSPMQRLRGIFGGR